MVPPHLSPSAADAALFGLIQGASQLFDPASIVRELSAQCATSGLVKVVPVRGLGSIVEIPNGDTFDYVVLGSCGHVSALYTSFPRAARWTCGVCAEQLSHDSWARLIAVKLQHVRSTADDSGGSER